MNPWAPGRRQNFQPTETPKWFMPSLGVQPAKMLDMCWSCAVTVTFSVTLAPTPADQWKR